MSPSEKMLYASVFSASYIHWFEVKELSSQASVQNAVRDAKLALQTIDLIDKTESKWEKKHVLDVLNEFKE